MSATTAAALAPGDWAAVVSATRIRLGLSRVAYAKHVGANPSSVENWESGTIPLKRFRPAILKLAALQVSPATPAPTDATSTPAPAAVATAAPPARRRTGDRLLLFSVFRPVTVGGRTLRRRIAEGVEFANGWVTLCWMGKDGRVECGVTVYPSLDDVVRLHCPDGRSDLVLRDL